MGPFAEVYVFLQGAKLTSTRNAERMRRARALKWYVANSANILLYCEQGQISEAERVYTPNNHSSTLKRIVFNHKLI